MVEETAQAPATTLEVPSVICTAPVLAVERKPSGKIILTVKRRNGHTYKISYPSGNNYRAERICKVCQKLIGKGEGQHGKKYHKKCYEGTFID